MSVRFSDNKTRDLMSIANIAAQKMSVVGDINRAKIERTLAFVAILFELMNLPALFFIGSFAAADIKPSHDFTLLGLNFAFPYTVARFSVE